MGHILVYILYAKSNVTNSFNSYIMLHLKLQIDFQIFI